MASRPSFESIADAVGFVIEQGLEYTDIPEGIIELDEGELRAIKALSRGKDVPEMTKKMPDYARWAYADLARGILPRILRSRDGSALARVARLPGRDGRRWHRLRTVA